MKKVYIVMGVILFIITVLIIGILIYNPKNNTPVLDNNAKIINDLTSKNDSLKNIIKVERDSIKNNDNVIIKINNVYEKEITHIDTSSVDSNIVIFSKLIS